MVVEQNILLLGASRWRIKLSILKKEFCIFSLHKQVLEEARNYIFEIDGQKVKYNPTPKILGVTLDEKLKFEMHTEQLERKASKTMALLRKVKETEVLNSRCMLQLLNGSFRPRVVSALSRFGPGSFRPGSFRPGSIRPWVVSAQFGGSFRPIFFSTIRLVTEGQLNTL